MITHHPDTRLLNEFASGALPLAQSLCVSLHLKYCDHCQRNHQRLQQLGSAMFERLAPQAVDDSLLEDVLSRLDEQPPLTFPGKPESEGAYPALLQRLMVRDYEDLDWTRVNSDLRISRLRTGDPDNEFAFYQHQGGRQDAQPYPSRYGIDPGAGR